MVQQTSFVEGFEVEWFEKRCLLVEVGLDDFSNKLKSNISIINFKKLCNL